MLSFILSIYNTEKAPAHQIIHIKFVSVLNGQQSLTKSDRNVTLKTAALIRVYLVPSGAKLIILLVVLNFTIKALFSF